MPAMDGQWRSSRIVSIRTNRVLNKNSLTPKANEQLQDNSFYQKLNVDPTAKHSDIVNSAIESFRKQELLSNSTASKLTIDDVKTSQFHVFPKVHKTNIPGRLVVSSVECHTIKISKFVDHYLQPHAKSLRSYEKDTSEFINRINKTKDINKDTILVTLDVKSLYTNIFIFFNWYSLHARLNSHYEAWSYKKKKHKKVKAYRKSN